MTERIQVYEGRWSCNIHVRTWPRKNTLLAERQKGHQVNVVPCDLSRGPVDLRTYRRGMQQGSKRAAWQGKKEAIGTNWQSSILCGIGPRRAMCFREEMYEKETDVAGRTGRNPRTNTMIFYFFLS